jgi:hypothetical protein
MPPFEATHDAVPREAASKESAGDVLWADANQLAHRVFEFQEEHPRVEKAEAALGAIALLCVSRKLMSEAGSLPLLSFKRDLGESGSLMRAFKTAHEVAIDESGTREVLSKSAPFRDDAN